MCRSRRELSNAYLLTKFRFDTAENEPSKVCRIDGQRELREEGNPRPAPWGQSGGCIAARPRLANCTRRPIHSGMRILTKLNRARSRLYRSQIMRPKHRWKALNEINKCHTYSRAIFFIEALKLLSRFSKILTRARF